MNRIKDFSRNLRLPSALRFIPLRCYFEKICFPLLGSEKNTIFSPSNRTQYKLKVHGGETRAGCNFFGFLDARYVGKLCRWDKSSLRPRWQGITHVIKWFRWRVHGGGRPGAYIGYYTHFRPYCGPSGMAAVRASETEAMGRKCRRKGRGGDGAKSLILENSPVGYRLIIMNDTRPI